MNLASNALRLLSPLPAAMLILGLAGCADQTVYPPSSGPGIENPAAAGGGDVIPSIGGAGNGGGVSGGGAGAGSAGQGAR